MKGLTAILLAFTAFCFIACSKSNTIATVNGTINGVPALTLYGSSGRQTDYVFLSTVAADKEVSYYGQTYNYYNISGNSIFITISTTIAVKATLDTIGTKTILTINTLPPTIFSSSQYSTK